MNSNLKLAYEKQKSALSQTMRTAAVFLNCSTLDVPPLRSVPISSLLGCEGKWVNLLIGNVFALIPVVFKFNRLLQQPNGYYLEGWMELPDGTWQQFGTVTLPYPASNIQVIWC
ncbi:hypothetical protein ABGV40_18335 [Paenibacillus amylolyticus]|uniref:hypothetical protein n=1 Tax=Paenibacillus amylolyticus TaxID=1451 RepID=UPI003242B562